MTRKGILTILKRWPFRRVWSRPAQSFALYSHRYVRFLSPLWFGAAVAGAVGMVFQHRSPESAVLLVATGIAIGLVPRAVPVLGRVAATLRSFLVANWAFLLGILGALRGDRSGRYTPTHGLAG